MSCLFIKTPLNDLSTSLFMSTFQKNANPEKIEEVTIITRDNVDTSDQRLLELGYKPEFRREMSLFGVLGISFCAIGILTGMSSAFQTGLFSGGPLGLFWGWNVSTPSFLIRVLPSERASLRWHRSVASSCFLSP